MTKEQLIAFLRQSVSVQASDVEDTEYLKMTDEDLENFMLIVLTRDFPEYNSLDRLPNDCIFSIVTLAKIELYYALAVKEAPEVDLGADGAYLKQSDRFNHYMSLIQQLAKDYQDYLDNGGAGNGTLNSYNVLLPNRYNTHYNYEKGAVPAPFLYIDDFGVDFITCSWKVRTSRFNSYTVYLSFEPVLDMYSTEKLDKSKVITSIRLNDVHSNKCRFKGLDANTTYFITLEVKELSGLVGYVDISCKTNTLEEVGGE